MMTLTPGLRLLRECDWRLLRKFAWNFAWKGMRAVQKFERRLRKKEPFFPAFTVISLTNRCNLHCRGCWVSQTQPPEEFTADQLHAVIASAKRKGSYFFGLLGGEPLLWTPLFEVIAQHPDCYFQLFTNGTLLTHEMTETMRRLGNITPLISIEGLEEESRNRRGKETVFERTLNGVSACRKSRLITGVSASICKSNFRELVSHDYLKFLAESGVHYLWYYIYRPVGPDPHPENALNAEEILALRKFIVEARMTAPLAIIDAYWDHLGRAVCPGAMGLSHHLSPSGAMEFCPPLQFAKERLSFKGDNLADCMADSKFLAGLRQMTAEKSRGCILLEAPDALLDFCRQANAFDSSNRGTAEKELVAMCPRAGHHQPGQEIPEKSFLYRFAKRHAFFGFGAYG